MFAVCIYLWYLLHQGVLKMFMQLILNLSFDKNKYWAILVHREVYSL